MRNTPLSILKVVLWFVCLCHIAIGLFIMGPVEMQQRIASLYGAKVDWTPQFAYILKPLGAFMFTLGAVGMAAAINPLRYRVMVYGFIGLLTIRVIQRITFRDEIHQAFAVDPSRNTLNAALFLALAVVLLVLLILAGRRATPEGA